MKELVKNCAYCGVESKTKYCSRKHRHLHTYERKIPTKMQCIVCCTEFYSYMSSAKYCSNKCKKESNPWHRGNNSVEVSKTLISDDVLHLVFI